MRPRNALATAGYVIAALLLAALAAPAAWATHEPDHRYYIVGTVTGSSGEPLCGVRVRVTDVDMPSTTDTDKVVTTDGSGRYDVFLHLHSPEVEPENHNVGDTIQVRVEGTQASGTAIVEQNTANAEGWGEKTVDLNVADGASNCFGAKDLVVYGAIGAGAVLSILVVARVLRRPRRGGRAHRDLRAVPGVTRVRARELEAAGIRGAKDLAGADPAAISKGTNLTPKQARLLVKRAQESLDPKAD